MKNIHIYPSDFSNASRIFRTVECIDGLDVFDSIELVGILGREEHTSLSDNISIRRFKRNYLAKNSLLSPFLKVFGHLFWLVRVFNYYRRENIACVNAHSLTVLPLCILLKLTTGAKLVYDTHELESQTNGAGKIRRIISKFIESKLIHFSDVNIFVSNSIREWYKKEYNVDNTHVILNCPISKDVVKNDFFRDKFSINEDKTIFLYQGVLSSGRGIEFIIEAFSKLENTNNVLVIMGQGVLEPIVIEAASDNQNIFFHEFVSPKELLGYTASADVGLSIIFPTSLSYEYCMPNKLFEYINAGIPVIVSPTLEQKGFVQSLSVGEVLTEYNVDSLVDTVKRVKEKNSYTQAIESARERYNWYQESKKIDSIYRELFSVK